MAPHRVLGQAFPGPTGAITIYEPSAGNEGLVENVIVANVLGPTGPTTRFRMFFTEPNEKVSYDKKTATLWDISVSGGNSYESKVFWGLGRDGPTGATGTIGVQSGTANSLTFTIFGREDPARVGPTGAGGGGPGEPLP